MRICFASIIRDMLVLFCVVIPLSSLLFLYESWLRLELGLVSFNIFCPEYLEYRLE